jgi:hypothetical protein
MTTKCEILTEYIQNIAAISPRFQLDSTSRLRENFAAKKSLEAIANKAIAEPFFYEEDRIKWENYEILDKIEFEADTHYVSSARLLPDGESFLLVGQNKAQNGIFAIIDKNGKTTEFAPAHNGISLTGFEISPNGKKIYAYCNRGILVYDLHEALDTIRSRDKSKIDTANYITESTYYECVGRHSHNMIRHLAVSSGGVYAYLTNPILTEKSFGIMRVEKKGKHASKFYEMPETSGKGDFFVVPNSDDIYYREFIKTDEGEEESIYHRVDQENGTGPKEIKLDHFPTRAKATPDGKYLITCDHIFGETEVTVQVRDIESGKIIKKIGDIPREEIYMIFPDPEIFTDRAMNIYVYAPTMSGGVITKVGRKW